MLEIDLNFDGDTSDDGEFVEACILPGPFSISTVPILDDGPSPGNGAPLDPINLKIIVRDDDGGSSVEEPFLLVINAPPVFGTSSADIPHTTFEYHETGFLSQATVDGAFSDLGVADRHTVMIEWGDGVLGDGVNDFLVLPEGARSFSVTREFSATDAMTVDQVAQFVAQVTDDDGQFDHAPSVRLPVASLPTIKQVSPFELSETELAGLVGVGNMSNATLVKDALTLAIKQNFATKIGKNVSNWHVHFGGDFSVEPGLDGISGVIVAWTIDAQLVDNPNGARTIDYSATEAYLMPYAIEIKKIAGADIFIAEDPDTNNRVYAPGPQDTMAHERAHISGLGKIWHKAQEIANNAGYTINPADYKPGYKSAIATEILKAKQKFRAGITFTGATGLADVTQQQAEDAARAIFEAHFDGLGMVRIYISGAWHDAAGPNHYDDIRQPQGYFKLTARISAND